MKLTLEQRIARLERVLRHRINEEMQMSIAQANRIADLVYSLTKINPNNVDLDSSLNAAYIDYDGYMGEDYEFTITPTAIGFRVSDGIEMKEDLQSLTEVARYIADQVLAASARIYRRNYK